MPKSKLIEQAEQKQSKFSQTRDIIYGNNVYAESNIFIKGWQNSMTAFSLTTAMISEGWPEFRDSVKNKAGQVKNWISNSAFGDAVKYSGKKIKKAAVVVKDVTVLGAKRGAELIRLGLSKVKEKAVEFKNSELMQNAITKTGRFFKGAGGWIRDKSVAVGQKVKGLFVNKIGEKTKLGLLCSEAAAFFKRKGRAMADNTVESAKAVADLAKKLAETKGGKKVIDAAKTTGKAIAEGATIVGHSVAYGAKKVAQGAKWSFNKVAPFIKSAAKKAANKFTELKSRFSDWNYNRVKMGDGKSNQVHEMLRERKYGAKYKEKLEKFREDIKKNKDIMKRLNLRKDLDRLNRNAGDMEKGNTGDIELQEMSEMGTFEKEGPGMGMLESINTYDLGDAHIEKEHGGFEKPDLQSMGFSFAQKDKQPPKREKFSLDDIEQEEKDEKLLKDKGIDLNNIPKTAGDNKIIGTGAKETAKLKDPGKLKKSGENVLQNNKSKNKKLLKNIATKSTSAAEKILDVAGVKFPLTNLGDAFSSAIDIPDPEKRAKSITSLMTNILDEAGKIYKTFGGDNSFSNIASSLNKNVAGMEMSELDAKEIKKIQNSLNNIEKGSKILGTLINEAGGNTAAIDKMALLGPIVNIIKGVENYHKLAEKNKNLNSLTAEDKSLNLTDNNVIRHINMATEDLVRQNEVKQTQGIMDTAVNATLGTVGILTGSTGVTSTIGTVLKAVNPTDLLVASMKNKNDHELMMTDAFGSMDEYRKFKHEHGLSKGDVQREINQLTNTSSVKEYANRVRMETALHLHSRTKQAEKYGIENGATKLREAGGLESKDAKSLFKEMGGKDYDHTLGKSKLQIFKEKLKQEKLKKAEAKKMKDAEKGMKDKDKNKNKDKKKGLAM